MRDRIDLHIYHGGRITLEPTLSYEGGSMESFLGWDIDVISSLVVGKFVKSIGYHSFKALWYRQPSVDGIRPLNCDEDVKLFWSDVKGHKEVSIFVEHSVDAHLEKLVEEDTIDSDVEIIGSSENKGKEKLVEEVQVGSKLRK